jgi:hypothetical protein
MSSCGMNKYKIGTVSKSSCEFETSAANKKLRELQALRAQQDLHYFPQTATTNTSPNVKHPYPNPSSSGKDQYALSPK